MTEDKLDIMMRMQKQLQEKLATEKFGKLEFNQEYINAMTLYLTSELYEALKETRFRYWKKNSILNKENLQEELIDCFHFFMNLLIAADIDSNLLYKKYCEKNKINYERQKNNY